VRSVIPLSDLPAVQHDNGLAAVKQLVGNGKTGYSSANYGHIGAFGRSSTGAFATSVSIQSDRVCSLKRFIETFLPNNFLKLAKFLLVES
jgi:hypothetical protein